MRTWTVVLKDGTIFESCSHFQVAHGEDGRRNLAFILHVGNDGHQMIFPEDSLRRVEPPLEPDDVEVLGEV